MQKCEESAARSTSLTLKVQYATFYGPVNKQRDREEKFAGANMTFRATCLHLLEQNRLKFETYMNNKWPKNYVVHL